MNKDNIDRREFLRKTVEKAMKQDDIECTKDNVKNHKQEHAMHKCIREEHERIRVYKARLADKICLDREFINHDNNLKMFEIFATYDII